MLYVNDSSRVWHVAKSGNDANGGHAGQYPVNLANDAKLTIGAAVSAASDGDTIIIWPGTYEESIDIGSKALNITGTHRSICKIAPATGTALTVGSNTTIKNLNLEGLQQLASIWGLRIGHGSGSPASNVIVDNCICNGYYDGCAAAYSKNVKLSNSIFIGGDGLTVLDAEKTIIDNCIIQTSDPVVDTANDHSGLLGSSKSLVIRNSIIKAIRGDANAKGLRGIRCDDSTYIALQNCIIDVYMPLATGVAYGIHVYQSGAPPFTQSQVVLENCTFKMYAPYASAKADIYASNGSVVVHNCNYSIAQGTVIQSDSGWSNALGAALFTNGAANKLKIDAAGAVDASNLGDIDLTLLHKAAKMLLNKAVQDKLTGEIQYFDDDGQTVIATHTPDEDESSFTRTAS